MIKESLRRLRVPKWLVWLVIILFVLVVCVYGYRWYWHMRMHGLMLFDWSKRTDTTLVEFTISDRLFRIPNNFFYSRHQWKNGRDSSFSLSFLLPDMQGRTKDNLDEFIRGGNRARMYVDLRDRDGGVDTHQQLINGARFQIEVPFGDDPPLGFDRRYVYVDGHAESYVIEKDGRFIFFLKCDWPDPNSNSLCKAHRDYSQGLIMEYTFSRDHLAKWHMIDKKVMEKLMSFEIKNVVHK